MTPAEALALLFDGAGEPWRRSQFAKRFGDAGAVLQRAGLMCAGSIPGGVPCTRCDFLHEAQVWSSDDGGPMRACCVEDGSIWEVSPDEFETLVFDRAALFDRLRTAFSCAAFDIGLRELVPGALWKLGETRIGGVASTVLVARALRGEVLGDVFARLPSVSKRKGIVLTAESAPVAELGGWRFASLSEVIMLSRDGGMIVDLDTACALIPGSIRPSVTRGRKPKATNWIPRFVEELAHDELRACHEDSTILLDKMKDRIPGLATTNEGRIAKKLIADTVQRIADRISRDLD